MTAEADITKTLSDHALLDYPRLRQDVAFVAAAVSELRSATDLLDVIRAADQLSMTMEQLAATAAAAHHDIDAALLNALEESGAPTLKTNGHLLGTRTNAPTIDIADVAAVPAEYLIAREPIPDRPKIREALKRDATAINWARFGTPTVSLTRRTST